MPNLTGNTTHVSATPQSQTLDAAGITGAVNPPHSGGAAKVTPTHMKIVLELAGINKPDQKALISSKTKADIWPIVKKVNWDGPTGQTVKQFMQIHLGYKDKDNAFNTAWPSVKNQLNTVLRQQRGYVLQQMKTLHFSKF